MAYEVSGHINLERQEVLSIKWVLYFYRKKSLSSKLCNKDLNLLKKYQWCKIGLPLFFTIKEEENPKRQVSI